MTNAATTTDPALVLAGIIRQVDGARDLSADALALAILDHPGSRWGPAEPPAAPRPELPKDPPVSGNWGDWWTWGYEKGWDAARAELQRQREGQGLSAPEPPAAPIFPHANTSLFRFDDDLIEMLIRGVMKAVYESTNKLFVGTLQSPVSEVRARLDEVLELAGYRAGDKKSS